jgi:3-methyladenine DNA glycosylase AlkD
MTTEAVLAEVRSQLAANADPKFREGLRWYFKETVDPYGVRMPQVRQIATAAYKQIRRSPLADRNKFCNALWKSSKMEEGSVAIYVYRRFRKQCASCEFHLFEKWLDRYVRNWAHCDGVASWLIAASVENEPELMQQLPGWTTSRNRWKRRAAAVSLIQEAEQGRNTDVILNIARALIEDPDDMVQKGVGWLLKETYPKKPREVMRFLKAWKEQAPRLVLRIAAEKMTAKDRRAIMQRKLQQ